MATRLPDWTASPLAALWFAVRESPAHDGTDGAVFVFPPDDKDYVDRAEFPEPLSVKRTLFFRPNHLSPRIVAQQGWFSIQAYNSKSKALSRLDAVARYKSRLERIILPKERFGEMQAGLDRMGVNEASMFPGLDGVTAHLNWQYSVEAETAYASLRPPAES